MPSLADIPSYLRLASAKDAFIHWLKDHPIDFATARALIHIWTKTTSTKLTTEEWLVIELSFRGRTNARTN